MGKAYGTTAFQKAVIDKAESLEWTATVSENNEWEFYKYSPAGEDFGFYIEADDDDVIAEVRSYANDFDPDDHAEMWIQGRGTNGIPSSIRALIEDAEQIKEMLDELADALEEFAALREE